MASVVDHLDKRSYAECSIQVFPCSTYASFLKCFISFAKLFA